MKELKLHYNTDEADTSRKVEQAKQFLTDGQQVKISIKFRGREIVHKDIGVKKLQDAADKLKELTTSTPPVAENGKTISINLNPKTRK